jgi:hypothetical protein
MIEEGMVAFLSADATVAQIVGGPKTRIWPLMVPKHHEGDVDKHPCLVYQRIGRFVGTTFCESDTLVSGEFQIDSYAFNYLQARTLAAAVKDRMVDYTGLMGTTSVDRVFLNTETDLLDPVPGLFRVSQSYTIWYRE